MKRKGFVTWDFISLWFLGDYGLLVLIQSQIDVWPQNNLHYFVMLIGGLAMLMWVGRYFIRQTVLCKVVDCLAIAVLTTFTLTYLILLVGGILQ